MLRQRLIEDMRRMTTLVALPLAAAAPPGVVFIRLRCGLKKSFISSVKFLPLISGFISTIPDARDISFSLCPAS